MKTSTAAASVFVGLIFLAPTASAQTTGAITGTVVDENNAPVAAAKVTADAFDGRPSGSLVRYVETDETGHFVIERLTWGKYRVFAKKESACYPDMSWSFYSNDLFPIATIGPTMPSAKLQIKLGPKAGVMTGVVTDAHTGAPVNAAFKLVRAASPDKWISTSVPSSYRVLLPTATEVLLEVSAPGFENWHSGHPLLVQSSAPLRLDIALKRTANPNLHPSRFLVPEGYEGWLLLEYNVKDAEPSPPADRVRTFRFPASGQLTTSSAGPETGADDEYFYYSPDGTLREIPQNYTNGKGMIWGQYEGSRNGVMTQFGFFIGSEEQFKKYQSQMAHPGPLPRSQ